MIFLTSLIIRTFISLSSNNWFGAWIGLEINLVSFIPLIYVKNNYYSSESSIKYFIIQRIRSIVLLFGIIILSFDLIINQSIIIMNCSLIAKLGIAPFHIWLPGVIEGLRWINCLILSTWQKIGTLILISYIIVNRIIIIPSIISLIIGSFGGINQNSIKKLIAYSSINNIGWIIIGITIRFSLWINYFVIYIFIVFNLIYLFMKIEINYLNQFIVNLFYSPLKINISIILFSFGGLPPILGFLPKLIVIKSLIVNSITIILIIIIITSLITLFYYIRISILIIIINSIKIKLNNNFSINNSIIYLFTFINIFGFSLILIIKQI